MRCFVIRSGLILHSGHSMWFHMLPVALVPKCSTYSVYYKFINNSTCITACTTMIDNYVQCTYLCNTIIQIGMHTSLFYKYTYKILIQKQKVLYTQ